MKVLVIGGTGHIGGFLVPMLVEGGHEVTVMSTGRRPAPTGGQWRKVGFVRADYSRESSAWTAAAAGTGAEAVIDIPGNNLPVLYDTVKTHCRHIIACGSVWMFGPPKVVPTPPVPQNPCESPSYALRYGEIEQVRQRAQEDGIAFTAVMPPNICGPGKIPLDDLGGRDAERHKAMMRGEPAALPERCNTLIGPCDASDVAAVFALAVEKREAAAGRVFNAGSAYALTAPEFIAAYSRIYGTPIPIRWVPENVFYSELLPSPGANFHFRHHMCPDISLTRALLGYEPQYTPEQAMARAVDWMRAQGLL